MHAVEGSSQQKKDPGNEVEVVDEPQLQCTDIYLSLSLLRVLSRHNVDLQEAVQPCHDILVTHFRPTCSYE